MNLKRIRSTREWHERRAEILSQESKCAICEETRRLHIHHAKPYKSEREYLEMHGVIILCQSCHYFVHKGWLGTCPLCGAIGQHLPRTWKRGQLRFRGSFLCCDACLELLTQMSGAELIAKSIVVKPIEETLTVTDNMDWTVNVIRGREAASDDLLYYM